MNKEKKLFLLDAYALIFRAYYAFIKNPRMNSEGLNTSAMFGFTNTLLDLLNRENPTHIAVCFDFPAKTVRSDIYPEYKANRDATPEDIKLAVPYIRKIIEGFNIPIIEAEGYEADDVIGTLAKKAEQKGFMTYMMTPDKDFGQLVSENIKMYKPARSGKEAEILGVEEICAKYGIEKPEQLIDILGMWGDAVDNIPGIPGVGEKTAIKFVQQYGSIEGLYEHTDELKGKMKEKVVDYKDQAYLSKKLATIILDVPVNFDSETLIREEPDKNSLKDIFVELEFRNLASKILGEDISMVKKETTTTRADSGQYNLFDSKEGADELAVKKTEDSEIATDSESIFSSAHNYHLVEDSKQLDLLLSKIEQSKRYCFDTETTGLNPLEAELIGISFCIEKGEAFYVSIPSDKSEKETILAKLKPLLEEDSKLKIGHNIKYDILILRKYEIHVCQPYFDTMLAHYILEPDMNRRSMDVLSELYLGYTPISIEELIGKKGKDQKNMADLTPEEVCNYACEDADVTFQLYNYFNPITQQSGINKLLEEMEFPLIEVLADMEEEGIHIDKKFLENFSGELENDLVKVRDNIYQSAGVEFNIASPKQVGEILFDHLKIDDKPKKTKTGQYATGEDILNRLSDKHEVVKHILSFRELSKLKNTYVDVLPNIASQKDGRVHTNFNQWVAATGRLSSDNPNLQNIPIKTKRGQEVRKAFIPKNSEFQLLSSDYSQVELRILASMSKDAGMIQAFKNGEDIHTSTAAKIFNVEASEVDREMRTKAKAVNFGIAYGQGAFGLSQNLNISRSEAKSIIEQYFEQFSGIRTYMDEVITGARETGYVSTIMGRRRIIKNINSSNHMVRSQAERFAINTPIQGSAADIIKIAMINIHRKMKDEKLKSRMLLQVHDELVFDAHTEELDLLKNLVKENMEQAVKLEVPLIVDMNAADNWLDAH